jgi:cytochrome b6-f complex iron-sulfur subunit
MVLGGLALVELAAVGAAFLGRGKAATERRDRETMVRCGHVDQYSPGTVTAFVRGRFYLTRLDDGGFLAISRQCTHLGCTVPWVEAEKRFVCPCHASVFDITGEVVNAPAPRALEIYSLTIENNVITVNTRDAIRRGGYNKRQPVYAKTP